MAKKPTSFKLSEEARKILDRLSKSRGISRTAVIETLIRDEAKRTKG